MNSRLRSTLAVSAALLLLLAGCASQPPIGTPPPHSARVNPDYLIGPDDVVAVNVWQNPELDVAMPVRSDGKITVPLIGDVQAGGLSPAAVAADIRESLRAYVHDAQVTVLVAELKSHEYLSRVRVTGAVRQPVSLPYRQGMTVLDAVLEAGGPTEFAAANRSALHRRDPQGGTRSYPVALGAMLERGELGSNYAVQPGDVITVPQRKF